jgi:NAD(P)-dependent dehydrogenase (short-subunit alcohol dehydrogenase family)
MKIVMTGGTSGIGLEALRSMLGRGVLMPVLGVRDAARVPADLNGMVEPRALDLASLASVRAFCTSLEGQPIDALVLNAGGQIPGAAKTADGFERTFAVNHLAHYLMIRLLLPNLTEGARIMVTASGTHDPAMKTGIPAPRHGDAYKLAFPGRDPERDAKARVAGLRAYSSSKLCNVMTVRELAVRTATSRPDLSILALDPAFVPGTGLARDYPAALSWIFRNILPIFVRGEGTSKPEISGRLMADLVLEDAYAHARGDYWSVRSHKLKLVDPSVIARDATACARLWDDSAEMVGVSAAL